MNVKQKGFTIIEVLIVVAVIGLLGVVGWLVYDRQNNKSNAEQASTSETQIVAQEKEPQPISETANWKEEKNTEYGFSYKYPNDAGWEAFLIQADPQKQATGERVNNAGVNYTLCGNNCGLAFAFQVFAKGSSADPGSSWGEKRMSDNSYYKLSSKTSVTKDGVTGTRWEYTPSESGVANIIYYYFTKGNLSYAFTINGNGATTDKVDITERGEKIMETFQFTN